MQNTESGSVTVRDTRRSALMNGVSPDEAGRPADDPSRQAASAGSPAIPQLAGLTRLPAADSQPSPPPLRPLPQAAGHEQPADTSTAGTPADESPSVAPPPPPVWHQRRKATSAEQQAELQARSQLAATIAEVDRPPLTVSQRILLWLTGGAATAYVLSLLLHAIPLAILSIVLVSGMTGDNSFSTLVSQSDEAAQEFDEIDTSLDPPGGQTLPEVAAITMDARQLLEQDPSQQVAPPDVPTVTTDPTDGDGDQTGDGEGDGGNARLFRMPESGKAVTKGSFTAWTVPEDPEPRKPYMIVIQVRLPDKTRRYRSSDLSGMVVGTDLYRQLLPWDPTKPQASRVPTATRTRALRRNGYLPIRDGVAQLIIAVPPAEALVQDKIIIRSRRLREQQTLSIEF